MLSTLGTDSMNPTYKPRSQREPQHYPTLINKPGELVMLPKNDLQIDTTYQRPVNYNAVKRIAANWNWVACGTLLVSVRTHSYFLVDGQHRWEGAKLREEIIELPCLAFEINDVKQEAIGFLAANTERRLPLMIHKFNALVAIEDPHALIVNELVKKSGRLIRSQTGKQFISCIGDLMRCVKADREVIERLWPMIIKMSADEPLPGHLIKGLFYLERKMMNGVSLTDPRLRGRIEEIGLKGFLDSIKLQAHFENNMSEKVCGQGVLRAINRGNRSPLRADL